MGHSSLARRHVPTCTPLAPSAKAAAICLPQAMPPAAITGTCTASQTCGTKAMVVSSPICPPLSQPSAIIPSAPREARRFARATEDTTGKTMMPASLKRSMYFPGFPAPVVTTLTFSSATISAILSASGFISMILTPKGLSVSPLQIRICSRRVSAFMPPAPMIPRAPASETAAAKAPSAMLAMPPWKTGNSIFKISLIFIRLFPFSKISAGSNPHAAVRQPCAEAGTDKTASFPQQTFFPHFA